MHITEFKAPVWTRKAMDI